MNSGAGSYGRLSKFKANAINNFIEVKDVKTFVELGCGDGNQLNLINYPKYVGFDLSKKAIEICNLKFKNDKNKDFMFYAPDSFSNKTKFIQADVSLSLDVIYHLVEDDVFHNYMSNLFNIATKYVIIYSSNEKNMFSTGKHVRHRKFTDWIEHNRQDFKLFKHIPNKYPFRDDLKNQSFADFYIFEKIN